MPSWFDKTLSVLGKVQDEVVKVSQMGKTHLDRSFLLHERNTLYVKLGKMVYELVKERKIHSPEIERLIEQIDRLSSKISEMEGKVKDLTRALSTILDADEHNDVVVKKKVKVKKARLKRTEE